MQPRFRRPAAWQLPAAVTVAGRRAGFVNGIPGLAALVPMPWPNADSDALAGLLARRRAMGSTAVKCN